jgi:hypothetical protein
MATTGQRKKTGVKPIIEEAEIADVMEVTRNGETTQTIKYKAPIKADELPNETNDNTENQDKNFDDEMFLENTNFEEIPKDKIDKIFDDIETVAKDTDYFYAKLTRIPDSMSDSFYIRCANEMPLGVFQFGLNDRFNFVSAIQKQNNNSGGRFNIQVFTNDQKLFQIFRGYANPYNSRDKQPVFQPVGAANVLIPNPVREEIKDAPNGLESILSKMIEMQRESNQQILNAINNRQQSDVEKLVMTKAIENLMSPPASNNASLEEKMMQFMMMPQLVNKMAERMFPEPVTPPAPIEPTTFDRILQLSQTPMVQNALERVGTIAEYIVEQKFTPPQNVANPPQQQNGFDNAPEQIEQPQNEEMKVILNELITELESDNPIDAENEMIKALRANHPEQFNMIQSFCKMSDFSSVFQMLLMQAQNIQPYPFEPFVTPDRQGFNDRGQRAITRLEQVYIFLRDN